MEACKCTYELTVCKDFLKKHNTFKMYESYMQRLLVIGGFCVCCPEGWSEAYAHLDAEIFCCGSFPSALDVPSGDSTVLFHSQAETVCH